MSVLVGGGPAIERHPVERNRASSMLRSVWRRRAFLPGVLLVVGTFLLAATVPYSTSTPSGDALQPFSAAHLLGTDELGRDLASRIVVGMRSALIGAAVVVAAGVGVGLVVGAIAGALGGLVDGVLMRIVDTFLALPGVMLAITVVAAIGPGFWSTILAISLVAWPGYARIVRGEVRRLRHSPHVEAARLGGAGALRVITRHLAPGAVPQLVVTATNDLGGVVLAIAGLAFLGLSSPEPAPELGTMSQLGMSYLGAAWWVALAPSLAVALIAVISNFTGDAARDLVKDR